MFLMPALIAALLNARWLWIAALAVAGVGVTYAWNAAGGSPPTVNAVLWNLALVAFWATAFKLVRVGIGLVVRRVSNADHAR